MPKKASSASPPPLRRPDGRGCPAGCWISRVANSVPAIDESTLRHLFDADLGWSQRIEHSDEMAHVAVASNPPEAPLRFQ